MKVFCGSFYQGSSQDSASNHQSIHVKGKLGKRPECIGQECGPSPKKLKLCAVDRNIYSGNTTPGDNLKTVHKSPLGCNTINSRYMKTSNKCTTSDKKLSNITADSDNSVFMGKPLCCAGIVGSKVITKDRKKSIRLRLKKMAKQLRGFHQPVLKNTEIKTLAVL